MKIEHDKQLFVCRRLRHMGFTHGRKVNLYGDVFELESNPVPQGSQYVLEAISQHSGTLRRIFVPKSITGLIEHEFDAMEVIAPAA